MDVYSPVVSMHIDRMKALISKGKTTDHSSEASEADRGPALKSSEEKSPQTTRKNTQNDEIREKDSASVVSDISYKWAPSSKTYTDLSNLYGCNISNIISLSKSEGSIPSILNADWTSEYKTQPYLSGLTTRSSLGWKDTRRYGELNGFNINPLLTRSTPNLSVYSKANITYPSLSWERLKDDDITFKKSFNRSGISSRKALSQGDLTRDRSELFRSNTLGLGDDKSGLAERKRLLNTSRSVDYLNNRREHLSYSPASPSKGLVRSRPIWRPLGGASSSPRSPGKRVTFHDDLLKNVSMRSVSYNDLLCYSFITSPDCQVWSRMLNCL